ncbi:leucine rich repeat domain-containing protein [Auriculariales sp. MPI-PUGE-AT-0066]|nr:leucine rich repeat domain-containing protein [Auriculariales sp. MPI-PUGE-AT-0066]
MESGDDYIRKTAALIRTNESHFAQAGVQLVARSRRGTALAANALYNPLAWIGLAGTPAQARRLVLSLDTHHLFYLLMRIEALGVGVGSLDVTFDVPFRPTSYIANYNPRDKSDTISIASFRSTFSTISALSLGATSWWGRQDVAQTTDAEVKFIYSAFTRLPALSLHKPNGKFVAELADDPPTDSAIPLDAFKSLHSLEVIELSISLRSLTDFTELFVDAVLDDDARRRGEPVNSRRRKLRHSRPRTLRSRAPSLAAVPQDHSRTPKPESPLKQLHWAFLKHLCLADNAITFFPSAPLQHLTALTHLDLSSNLLVSLYNLVSLNLADNMIESVLGIYTMMGQVLTLNLSHNRLDSLCGLERLAAWNSAEVGRLAVLPNIAEVSVDGNPFYEYEPDARLRCFEYFAREGKSILLDGSPPGYYERRQLTVKAPEDPKRMSIAMSPPVVAVVPAASPPPPAAAAEPISLPVSPEPSHSRSPPLHTAVAAVLAVQHQKPKKRAHMRIVRLDGEEASGSDDTASQRTKVKAKHSRRRSEVTALVPEVPEPEPAPAPAGLARLPSETDAVPELGPRAGSMTIGRNARGGGGRHSRISSEAFAAPPKREPTLPAGVRNKPGVADMGFGGLGGLGAVNNGTATIGPGSMSRSAARRARVSASVYEPAGAADAVAGRMSPSNGRSVEQDAEAFRAKIEALRNEVGDSWLKVLSQSQFSPKAKAGGDTPSGSTGA